MRLGDTVFIVNNDGQLLSGKVIGVSDRFFGERRKDSRAVSNTHLVELESGIIMLDLGRHTNRPS